MTQIYALGPLRLDTHDGVLLRGSEPLALGRRAAALLQALVERPGALVSKDALLEAAWPGRVIEDNNLAVQIAALRRVLRAAPGGDRWIETMPGRGYRFVGPVAAGAEDAVSAPPPVAALPDTAPIRVGDAERRQITALFCELVGVAQATGGMELEDVREVIREFQRSVSETAGRYEGSVARCLGNTVLVLFGYPEAHEDDAERAVRAGLELCAAVRAARPDAGLPMRCRVGIATGCVIIGDQVGIGAFQGYGVIGGVPNLAARLRRSGPPNTVVVGPTTRRLIGNLFDCREVDAIDTESGVAPMRRWQVLGEGFVASRFEALHGPALSPLIGRDEEIELMLRRWARAQAGDGQIVLLSGEPGIGKSRLTAALEERLHAEPHLYLRYFCSPHHRASALFPFVDQLGRAAGFARDDTQAAKWQKLCAVLARAALPDEDVALLADLLSLPASERRPPPNLNPQRKKDRTLEALLRPLEAMARRQPTLVLFEDLQWVDPTSRELLDLTVERVQTMPVLLIVTSRAEFPPPWIGQPHVAMLALNRLDRRDRAALIAEMVGGKALPDEVMARIADRTDGVPLFVEELTRSVLESGLLREEADRWVLDRALPAFAIPTTLHASLLARIDRLASVRHIAEIGAAIGRQFPYALLRAIARLPDDELRAALKRVVASELVFQRGTPPEAVYTFKHALVQDAAHASLLRDARRQLHREIAAVLEADFPELVDREPERLAQHCTEAGLIEQSVAYWGRAARRSAGRAAMAEAAAQFQQGLAQLALLPDSPGRRHQELEFCSALAAVLRAAKGHAAPETSQAYARAIDLWERLGCPSEYLSISYGSSDGKAYDDAFRGEFGLAERLAARLLRLSGHRDDKAGLFLGHFALGQALIFTGRFALSRSHLEAALEFYDSSFHRALVHQTGIDPRGLAEACLGNVLFIMGYPEQAVVRTDSALTVARSLAHPPSLAASLFNAWALSLHRGDTAAMAGRADELAAIAAGHAFSDWRALVIWTRGWIAVNGADASAGISLLRRGAAAVRSTGAEGWTPMLLGFTAKGFEIAGQMDEAMTLLEDALEIVARTGERRFTAEFCRHQGQLLLRQGDAGAAEQLYHKALSIAREQEARLWELRAATNLARLWRDQGRRAQAGDLLAPLYGWFTEGFATPDLKDAKALLDEVADQSAKEIAAD